MNLHIKSFYTAVTVSVVLNALMIAPPVHSDSLPVTVDEPIQLDIRPQLAAATGEEGTLWTTNSGLTQDALLLIDQIAQIDLEGLDASRYNIDALTTLVDLPWQPELRLPLNQLLAEAFEQLVTDLGQGIVNPRKVQRLWFQQPAPVNAKSAYLSLRLPGNSVKSVVGQYRQPNPEYKRLSEALVRYREFAANGGWPFIAPGPTLRPGDKDSRVFKLAQRLDITGDLRKKTPIDLATKDGVYTNILAEAVRRFQRRHGLGQDSVIGPETLSALNITVAVKIEKLLINLERMRWMPRDLGERHVITNIPDYRLKVVDRGTEVLTMPIVAGKAKFKTPVFSDEIEFLVVNPNWTVPKSIMYRELLPRERREPGFLSKRNFELITEESGQLVIKDPNTLTNEELLENRFRYTIRQKPGRGNALGKVKFIFPNKYSIYLHDTPSKSLFKRTKRAFSHGCVRVGNPQELAKTLLGFQGWTGEEVDRAFTKDKRRVLKLESHIPNHIVYLTAWEDERQGVQFREDVYGHDKDLAAAIKNPHRITWPATVLAALE